MADPFFKDLAFAALAQTARNPTGDFNRSVLGAQQLQRPADPYLRQQYPEVYGGLGGFMGMAPDEMAGSVLDPNTARVRAGAQIGFPIGTATQVVPALNMIRPAVKAGARALGPTAVSMGEGYLQRRGLMPELDVYHGSPYKFDRFDASKIGTGEGAQSYGYGLYFAENPAVSESYQKMISIGKQLDPLSKQAQKFVKENMIGGADNDAILKAAAASKNQAARWDLEDVKRGIPASRNDYVSAMDEVQEFLRKNPIAPNDGSLYKVNLPDEQIAKMLDWDKPMSEQSDAVKAAIGLDKNPNASIKDLTGLEFYVAVGGKLGNPSSSSKEAANYFVKKGIPGIKYLDANSRGGGQGTRNFVIFPGEEQSLTILERNNQPVQQAMNEFEQSLINFMATPAK